MFQSLDVQVGEQKWNPEQHPFSNDLPELVSDSDEEPNLPLASSNYQEEESGRLAALLTDSDSDDSSAAPYSLMENFSDDDSSSDTSEDDFMLDGYLSDDSSVGDYEYIGGEMGVLEVLNQQLEAFSNIIPSFFGVSLQMLYDRLANHLFGDEEKPTPQHILDSLPKVKVTISQLASKACCCICFGEYIINEDILQFPCNHYYHSACVLNWLNIKSTCPTCRFDLTKVTSSGDTSVPNLNDDYPQAVLINELNNTDVTNNSVQNPTDALNFPSANFPNHFIVGNPNRNLDRYGTYTNSLSAATITNNTNIEATNSVIVDNRANFLGSERRSESHLSDANTNNQRHSESNAELRYNIFASEAESSKINVEPRRNISKIRTESSLTVRDAKTSSRETEIW